MRALAAAASPSTPRPHTQTKKPSLPIIPKRSCCSPASHCLRPPRSHVVLCQRRGNHNVNEGDTDDMFDDLLKKHGKVVYRRGDQKRPSAEADDDAESLSCNSLSPMDFSSLSPMDFSSTVHQ